MKASEYYKTLPVNVVNQNWDNPNDVTIRIYKEGWKKAYSFKVKDYGTDKEKVTQDEEVAEGGE